MHMASLFSYTAREQKNILFIANLSTRNDR